MSLFIIIVICLIGVCIGGGDSSEPADSTDTTAVTEETTEAVSQEYKNALTKAQQYSDTMYMSKAGIYDQLTSEYGEGFPEDAAQYAVDNVVADWKFNALQKWQCQRMLCMNS